MFVGIRANVPGILNKVPGIVFVICGSVGFLVEQNFAQTGDNTAGIGIR